MTDVAAYHERLGRVLDRMGGVYQSPDLIERIRDGRMQSFVVGNSWLITEINHFPRARTLDFVAVVGDLQDMPELEENAIAFAGKLDIAVMRAHGRRGWRPMAEKRGWRPVAESFVFLREL